MTDKVGSIESERLSSYYNKSWPNDAVPRYFYAKVSLHCTCIHVHMYTCKCTYVHVHVTVFMVCVIKLMYLCVDCSAKTSIGASYGNTSLTNNQLIVN